MLEYKHPEEKAILLHYADKMQRAEAKAILLRGAVRDKHEALVLSKFYWDMLDIAADDQGEGIELLEQEGIEVWMEYIFHSLNGYLVSNGYEAQWDEGDDNE